MKNTIKISEEKLFRLIKESIEDELWFAAKRGKQDFDYNEEIKDAIQTELDGHENMAAGNDKIRNAEYKKQLERMRWNKLPLLKRLKAQKDHNSIMDAHHQDLINGIWQNSNGATQVGTGSLKKMAANSKRQYNNILNNQIEKELYKETMKRVIKISEDELCNLIQESVIKCIEEGK